MKAKLILKKHNDCYSLNDYREPSKGYPLVIAHSDDDNFRYKLSKQNCDEIFGVVDVEKLCKQEAEKLHDKSKHEDWDVYNCLVYEDTEMIKIGFNKAMELNKDKVFTEEQMFRMFLFGHSLSEAIKRGVIEDKPVGEIFDDRIKFIQQLTEIEVMIEMECDGVQTGLCSEDCDCNVFPKLDSEGCLILIKI